MSSNRERRLKLRKVESAASKILHPNHLMLLKKSWGPDLSDQEKKRRD